MPSLPSLRHDRDLLRVAALACALGVAVADFATWIELDIASLYSVPLVLAAATRSRRLLWLLTAALGATTFVVYGLQIPPGLFSPREPYFINRVLDVVAILVVAAILHVWIRSVEVREAQMRLLDEQNRKLEAANAELVVREAQIARQSAELELRRREAEEASGRKTRLLASVSHDLRTPLNAIKLTANAIGISASDPRFVAEMPPMIDRLQRSTSSLLEAVSDLLDIASFDSGRIERHDTFFALGELVAEKCDDVRPLAQAKGLRVDIDAPVTESFLCTDRAKLGRILSNLVTNAIKYTDAGGVRVSIDIDDEGVLIAVADTGIGIAPERLERLFDEYGQLSSSTMRSSSWGLGLAICRRLAHLLGGRIDAESMLNRGSVFTIRLPEACVLHVPDVLPSRQSAAAPN
ncbi:MAG TPA: HAMP domain-containing sensor histidine kinase [Casimicrobiaceae bacterium]|nr:HAMP domain-containing sensor histidine kinase [Casimicrobiaceae bacterium]